MRRLLPVVIVLWLALPAWAGSALAAWRIGPYRAARIETPGSAGARAAQAIALAKEARALIMDEPLSDLDAKLRVQMRAEISALHKRLRITTLYVTHDQVEAMTMGERITVLESGEIVAIDSRVAYYNDDAEEMVSNGSMYLDSSDLELSSDDDDNQIIGTSWHGLFESSPACGALLDWAGLKQTQSIDYHALRDAEINRLADCIEQHLDLSLLDHPMALDDLDTQRQTSRATKSQLPL